MNDDPTCRCGHQAQVHAPGGDLAATRERGRGECTAGPWGHRCPCERYIGRKHPSVVTTEARLHPVDHRPDMTLGVSVVPPRSLDDRARGASA